MAQISYKDHLRKIFLKSVAAVNPAKLISENVKMEKGNLHVCDKVYDVKDGNIYLVGFGKAVLGMAIQCEKILQERLKRGIISVPASIQKTFENNFQLSLKTNSVITAFEGARNNLPDENALKATDAVIELVTSLKSERDNLIVLVTGGGSALLSKPKPGLSLADKVETTVLLASSGANITELNTVRKKLSKVKGGNLGLLSYPVRTICLVLSDVLTDPLDLIASGPTVPNLDSKNAAFEILQKYHLVDKVPKSVLEAIKRDSNNSSVPIVNDQFTHVDNFLIGNNWKALHAAKLYAEELGFKTVIMSKQMEGLVLDIADFYTALIFKILHCLERKNSNDLPEKISINKNSFILEDSFIDDINKAVKELSDVKKMCVLVGGESTVKVQGSGKGGRNQELALIMLKRINELQSKHPELFKKYDTALLMAGTDGIDGPTDAAGAVVDTSLMEKAAKMDLNVNDFLINNDSYNFFSKVDEGSYLIKTGHTGTNVADIHILMIYEKNL